MLPSMVVAMLNCGRLCLHVVLLSLVWLSACVCANDLRDSLFASSELIYTDAVTADAELLAPISYVKAKSYYDRAEKNFLKNKSVDKIKSDLRAADEHFKRSIAAANLARLTLETAIKARNDALSVSADTEALNQFRKAEGLFLSAAQTMEKGSLAKVKKYAANAESWYRDAELTAIKNAYLNQVRAELEKAKKAKVKKFAPLTLIKAQDLLVKAETELSENRYDTDYPRALVKQALYEAKHSMYLAEQVKVVREGDVTTEAYLLQQEKPLAQIAEQLDLVAEFDRGLIPPAEAIAAKVDMLSHDAYELKELQAKMAILEKDYAVLEQRLGIQSERLQSQEKARESLALVNRIFTKHEAQVFMQGDNIIIRAVGLSFDPGSTRIMPAHNELLSKIRQVVRILQGYKIVVEGHTDSFGSDESNLTLSLARANAVRDYLAQNSSVFSLENSEAVGYGETRPIANNETMTGRGKNRRIDLVFMPQ